MEFQDNKAIYLQLADHLCLDIMQGRYGPDERIPSVREFAGQMEVNANTAVRAYDWMQSKGIIYTRRGLGYFVSPEAGQVIRDSRRQDFMHEQLPALFRDMQALDITIEDIAREWAKHLNPPEHV